MAENRCPLLLSRFSFTSSRNSRLSGQENEVQGQLWEIEYQIESIQLQSYNATSLCDLLRGFTKGVSDLEPGERRLLIESVVDKLEVGKNKRVVLALRPPLASLWYFSLSLAPGGIVPRTGFNIILGYDLNADHCKKQPSTAKTRTKLSGRYYYP